MYDVDIKYSIGIKRENYSEAPKRGPHTEVTDARFK